MHKRIKQNAGFTLIELLVTMTILGLMLFLLNSLFQDTSAVVTRSVQTSKVIANTRSISEQVKEDSDEMVGPASGADVGGYIVIIQRRLPNVRMLDPFDLTEVTVPQLRCDQIVFIRNAEGLRSMTPQDSSGFGSNLVAGQNSYAKVWYGIGQRTAPDGSRLTGSGSSLGGQNAGLDRIGSNFILGRQAMLFNPIDTYELTKAAPRANATVQGNPSQYIYADTAYGNAVVNNAGFPWPPSRAFMGLTDVTVQSYGPATNPNSLLFDLTDPSNNAAVQLRNYLYTAYPSDANRLRVNPNPDSAETNYASWAIAQAHAILAQNCSEIIIDFAADLNGNGRIDTIFGGGVDTNRTIWWYDALTQPNLGTATGWARPSTGIPQPYVDTTVQPGLSVLEGDTRAFVFRVEDDEAHPGDGSIAQSSCWPYLIRIRYRLHDTRGRITSVDPSALNDGLDNDGDGAVDENDEDKISGRWFEHIIRVPRP